MKIPLSQIDPNPHRDLNRNPVEPSQIQQIVESIERTGFWDNVVVRENGDRYELAYGHNRWQALLKLGTESASFIVKPLSDYDMLAAMIDENATQRNQTPRIIFENVDAAIRLAEHLIGICENVNEFNEKARTSHRSSLNDVQSEPDWRENEFQRARSCIESGEGLGKDFVKHFLPGTPPADETLQAVIDSHYAQSRKAAAEKAAAEAKAEADRLVQESLDDEERAASIDTSTVHGERDAKRATNAAEQKRKRAEKAAKTAEKHEKKAERIDTVGFNRGLLERLPSSSHMRELIQLARSEKIPSEHHERLVETCLREGWTTGGGRSHEVAHTILNAGRLWWYRESGQEAAERRANAERAQREKYKKEVEFEDYLDTTRPKIRDLIKRLDAIKPFADLVENQELIKLLDAELGALISVSIAIREKLPRPENVIDLDLKRLEAFRGTE